MSKTVKFPLLLASGFFIQFPLIFLAIAIGTIGRSFDLPIGNAVGLLLSPGIAYFWEGFHSSSNLSGLLIGVIVNTIYFAVVLFLVGHFGRDLGNLSPPPNNSLDRSGGKRLSHQV